jgi:hypothetical protein
LRSAPNRVDVGHAGIVQMAVRVVDAAILRNFTPRTYAPHAHPSG